MTVPWYRSAFGSSYLTVYRRRDEDDARRLAELLRALGCDCGGRRVLDIGCGQGRHLRVLEGLGAEAYGIDLSADLLSEARRHSSTERICQADMRELPFRDGSFDLAVSLFTSFGYFEADAENLRVLREAHRVLKRGGRFLLDYLNPERVLSGLVPQTRRSVGSIEVLEKRWIDPERGRVQKRVELTDRSGASVIRERWTESVRLWTAGELRRIVEGAGFQVARVSGASDGRDFSPECSDRMILYCTVGD